MFSAQVNYSQVFFMFVSIIYVVQYFNVAYRIMWHSATDVKSLMGSLLSPVISQLTLSAY